MITQYKHSKLSLLLSWSAQVLAAIIMIQTLYFKFTGAEESIYIFTKVGIEPWGRYATGVTELIASMLLLIPAYSWVGAAIACGLMSGAIFLHATILGFHIMNDKGYLFILAICTFLCSLLILYIRKNQIPYINRNF
jgi:putative oxidoreductase